MTITLKAFHLVPLLQDVISSTKSIPSSASISSMAWDNFHLQTSSAKSLNTQSFSCFRYIPHYDRGKPHTWRHHQTRLQSASLVFLGNTISISHLSFTQKIKLECKWECHDSIYPFQQNNCWDFKNCVSSKLLVIHSASRVCDIDWTALTLTSWIL